MRTTTTILPHFNSTINKKVATPHPYSFNGMEKDDEVKGANNSLDFGARIYDNRIGRFLSLDPRMHEFSFMTPYCYAGNNPIRFVDVQGKGPGDVISERVNNTGNLVIYVTNDKEKVQHAEYNFENTHKNWDVLYVKSISDAADRIEELKMSLDNVAIVTHGTGEEHSPTILYNKKQYGLSKDDIGNESPNDKKTLEAFSKIGKHMNNNGQVLFTACSTGADEEFNKYLFDSFKNENIEIFIPNDNTTPFMIDWGDKNSEMDIIPNYDENGELVSRKKVPVGCVENENVILNVPLIQEKNKVGDKTGFSSYSNDGANKNPINNITISEKGEFVKE